MNLEGPASIVNCTVSKNTAGNAGGIYVNNTSFNTGSSIVAGNIANSYPDIYNSYGTVTSRGSNLISNGSGSGLTNGFSHDQIGTTAKPIDPHLAALADNGGHTKTMALLFGSPAIDADYNTFVSVDQRGVTRSVSYDIGAFDYGDAPIGTLQFSAASYSISEGGGLAVITVKRVGGSKGAVSVTYGLDPNAGGTASNIDYDYAYVNGTLTWSDGDTADKTYFIPIVDDTLSEPSETLKLALSNPTNGATVSDPGTTTLTILDNDPNVVTFTPASGPVGTSVTITGTNLTGADGVSFNGVGSSSLSNSTATSITAIVPQGATTGPIKVSTPKGIATSATNFTVTPSPPAISLFAPVKGVIGAQIVIAGSHFTGATIVKFNNTVATTFTVNSDNLITATLPTGATTGTVKVQTSVGTATSATTFTVTIAPPGIGSFSPSSGPVGSVVTITGANFVGVSAVKFNGVASNSITTVSPTSLKATVPAGATTGPISVTTPTGMSSSSSAFVITPAAPAITSFTPASAPVGTSITIAGSNLIGTTSVKFNGVSSTSVSSITATSLKAIVPPGATTGKISIVTPGGSATSATAFTVTIPVPTISAFSPATGRIGTSILIAGANFTGATSVKFNGTSSTSIQVLAPTFLKATVPAGATTGKISITTPGGTANSSSNYTVTP